MSVLSFRRQMYSLAIADEIVPIIEKKSNLTLKSMDYEPSILKAWEFHQSVFFEVHVPKIQKT